MLDGLYNLVTPENFAEVLTKILGAIGVIVTALAGKTLWTARNDPSKPQTPEQFVTAYNHSLQVNNGYLQAMAPAIGQMALDIHETKRILEQSKDALGDIRLELARRGR